MVRGGVPQSIAMRVTGHRSRSMFDRYDIASLDDKLEALHRAREYAKTRGGWRERLRVSPRRGNMVAVQGFEPRTQRI